MSKEEDDIDDDIDYIDYMDYMGDHFGEEIKDNQGLSDDIRNERIYNILEEAKKLRSKYKK